MIFEDLKKMSDIPVEQVYKLVGSQKYMDCNNSDKFTYDDETVDKFHQGVFKKYSCVLPFWWGILYAEENNLAHCSKNNSFLYNDTWANEEMKKTVQLIPIKPCNQTKIFFGPVHTSETGKRKVQLTIHLPRNLEM